MVTGVVDGEFAVTALELSDGTQVWQKSYPMSKSTPQPLSTPAITSDGMRVFAVGPTGRYDCWEMADGANVWSDLMAAKFPGARPPAGGRRGSPLLVEPSLFVEVGSPSYSMVKFSVADGREAWRIGKAGSLGATPVPATIGNRKLILCRNEFGLVARDRQSGARAWQLQWSHGGRVGPLALPGGQIFLTAPDRCELVKVSGRTVESVWKSRSLCSDVARPVAHRGALFGFDGEDLVCVDVTTGERRWERAGFGGGRLIRAADHLVIQCGTSGELVIADADPEKYSERSRIKVFEGRSHTAPVFANGRVFCRSSRGELTCVGIPNEPEE